jgi:DNA processing protein
MAEEISYWLALSLTPGIGSVLFKRLLDRFKTPKAVFNAGADELSSVEGLGEKVIREIKRGAFEKEVEKELHLLHRAGAMIVTFNDDQYPKRLKEIYDPPPLLYIRGELRKEDELAVAIVGSRKTSSYGRWITEKVSR